MYKTDFDDLVLTIKELWPNFSGTDTQYGMLWVWFRNIDVEDARQILFSKEIAGTEFFPKSLVAKKVSELSAQKKKSSPPQSKWTDCYFVCVESGGSNTWVYPGRLIEMCFPANMSPIELEDSMRREVHYWVSDYGYWACRFEFYMGQENFRVARQRARKVFDQAKADGALPERFSRQYHGSMGAA